MSKLTRFAFFALAFLLILTFLQPDQNPQSTDDVIIEIDTEIPIGKAVLLTVTNNSGQTLEIPNPCPTNPLRIEQSVNGEWVEKEASSSLVSCEEEEAIRLSPEETQQISYAAWNSELFNEMGRYKIILNTEINGEAKEYTREIDIVNRGIFRWIGQEAFYKPILNTLVTFIAIVPGNSLGLAIILLTLIIKLILLVPSQKGMKAQRQMQKIQPQLDALKKKYQKDPQKLTAETMKIWKKHKVSPMSSCLPLLIQMPIIFALFYVVKDGVAAINPQLLYSSLADFDPSTINPHFLGLNLTEANWTVLPIIIGGLQFIQLKLSMGRTLKKQKDSGEKNPMQNISKAMMYFMPLLLAFFTATFPAGVAMYWGTNTLFSIGQQWVVNRSK